MPITPAQRSSREPNWRVTDPARVAAGFYGTTWHRTRAEAERRVSMFPGSVIDYVAGPK